MTGATRGSPPHFTTVTNEAAVYGTEDQRRTHLFSGNRIPILLPTALHTLVAHSHEGIVKVYWHEGHRELMYQERRRGSG